MDKSPFYGFTICVEYATGVCRFNHEHKLDVL